jgi:hypothetical protein
MRLRGLILGAVIIIAGLILSQGAAIAEEGPEFNPLVSIKENFQVNVGKRISVRTESGDTIDGTIARIGDHNVHISKLTGKDFYDTIVRIDKIESFTFRAR